MPHTAADNNATASVSDTPRYTLQWKICLGLILCVALGIRIAAATYWHAAQETSESHFRLGDSHSYWTLAEQIAEGKPYQYGSENASIFRAPLYPIILAPFTRLTDPSTAVFAARCMGCLLGTLSVGLLAILACRIGGPRSGLLAAALGCIYPSSIGMSITVLSEALFMPLMLGHLLLWQAASRPSTRRAAILYITAGCLAGLAILARPSWLLFIPFSLVLGSLVQPDRKRYACGLLLGVLGVCLVMTPWWIRNASITGKFVPSSLQVGPSLYDGWHAGATGASDEDMVFSREILERQIAEDALATGPLESTLEWRVNQRAVSEATAWAKSHPIDVMRLAGAKFMRTWSLWPDGGENGSFTTRLAITLSSFSILLLAIGFTATQRHQFASVQRFSLFIVWLPCLYFTSLHMVFVGSVRYREPAVFLLIALAGCMIDSIIRNLNATRRLPQHHSTD